MFTCTYNVKGIIRKLEKYIILNKCQITRYQQIIFKRQLAFQQTEVNQVFNSLFINKANVPIGI